MAKSFPIVPHFSNLMRIMGILSCMLQTNGMTRASVFSIENGQKISKAANEVDSRSKVHCVFQCAYSEQCCKASYNEELNICRLDFLGNCCLDTEDSIEDALLSMKYLVPRDCIGCVTYESSVYKIIESPTTWTNAEHECLCLGGKLIEIESREENKFIKGELVGKISNRYWLGGYNFDSDFSMEWISSPDNVMPFTHFFTGEPNLLADEFCLQSWRLLNFQWLDSNCSRSESFICEFET